MTENVTTHSRRSKLLLGVLAAGTLALTATLVAGAQSKSTPATETQPAARDTIAWAGCEDGAKGWQCATLTVPIDYSKPDGATIELALTRLPASDPARRIGPLVLNYGGPGGPAVSTSHEMAKLTFSDEIRARFDLVGFDPRGVGASAPLDCKIDLEAYFAVDPTPDTAVERQAQRDAAKAFADDCAANGGPLLPFMGTDNVVRDMERLRQALGEERVSFWGPSYGTSIAVQYAEQYPTHVRAFSVEDVLATELDGNTWVKEVVVGYEQSFNAFLAYCSATPECAFHSGGNAEAAYDALMARLERQPLVAAGDPRPVGQGDILLMVDRTLWAMKMWPALGQALAAADTGDAATLRTVSDNLHGRQPDATYPPANGLYTFMAVHCLDNSFPRSVAAYEALSTEVLALAPRAGAYYLNAGFPCVFWHHAARPTPATPTGHGAPPLLVVGATQDTQTPYIWAQRLSRQLEGAVLLTRDGAGHTSYWLSKCVAETVDAYLIDLKLPAPGTVCDSTGGFLSLSN